MPEETPDKGLLKCATLRIATLQGIASDDRRVHPVCLAFWGILAVSQIHDGVVMTSELRVYNVQFLLHSLSMVGVGFEILQASRQPSFSDAPVGRCWASSDIVETHVGQTRATRTNRWCEQANEYQVSPGSWHQNMYELGHDQRGFAANEVRMRQAL